MARTNNKTMVYFPVGVGIMCVICLFTVAVPVKGYSGYDGARTPPPNSNNATIQTFIVNVNQTFQIVAKRLNADYELALFKDGNKVLALPKNNKTLYVNPENKKDKEKNKKHFQMLFTNGSYFQIIFKSGSSAYIQGHYVVRYYMNGRMPPEDPEPLSFSIEINTTAEANIVSTQGINEEHPQHVLTRLPSPKIPPTPTTGLQARKTQMHVPWEILVLAVTVVVLVVIFASIKWLWYRNSE